MLHLSNFYIIVSFFNNTLAQILHMNGIYNGATDALNNALIQGFFLYLLKALVFSVLSTEVNIPKFADHTINIEPGTNINWDGNPW